MSATLRVLRNILVVLAVVASVWRETYAESDVTITVTVDTTLDRRVISPAIYGVSYGDIADFAAVPYPVRRWGGNATTRYSWQYDTHNTANDWFYFNIPDDNAAPGNLPDGSSADRFVEETLAAGTGVVMTIPTIGWAPKDRAKRWGFSVAKYGAQQSTECTRTGGAPWCTADAGNGVRTNGTLITPDPTDTSVPVNSAFEGDWITHLMGQFGNAAGGGIRWYALDNEPMLWNSTHRDVHPNGVTYDELWSKTLDYGGVIKAHDPTALVLGPDCWGWCDYFYSAADGCSAGPDRAAHGGLGLIEWYLQQVHAHELSTGTRLVDVLDIHWYPQGGTALNDDESSAASALRLRTLKGLYDPTYVDESWIGQPVNLIPRMRGYIAARAPGLGLAITEYNFGGDTGISSALAQAEALAIFGREGVDLATRWVAPQSGTLVEDAFKLYLNYDGAGARVTGTNVRAASGSVDQVGAYAVVGTQRRRFVLLFNKNTAPQAVNVHFVQSATGSAQLYRFHATQALAPAGTAPIASNDLALTLPARSATLAVVDAATVSAPLDPASHVLALRCSPNPLRSSTEIRFEMPLAGRVSLTVCDVTGRLVRTLEGEALPAGAHQVAWDGRDDGGRPVRSGLYLCHLAASGHEATERISVVR